jgi:DNA polymerase-1
MLTSKGDRNLCRAYIPFDCHERDDEWYLNEDPNTKWHPIDLHALTTKNAFHMTGDEPNFKEYRGKGKQVNFSMVYGATGKTISESLETSKQEGYKIYNAFYNTYPGIKDYDNYVKGVLYQQDFIPNLFQRKYYGVTAHKAKNYLIQGSGADYTKKLLREIVDFIEDKGTLIEGYLHDEFSFLVPYGEEDIVYDLQAIMEQLETDIKLKVDIEISETDWSEKRDY